MRFFVGARVWLMRCLAMAGLSVVAVGCGAHHGGARARPTAAVASAARAGSSAVRPGSFAAVGRSSRSVRSARVRVAVVPLALVTDEAQGLLAVADLRSPSARLFIGLPGNPEYVAAEPGAAVATSPAAGAVAVLAGDPLRVVRVLRGFGAPEVTELSADGRDAFVTDGARGTLTVIGLRERRVLATLFVGAGAHHIAVSPDGRRLWIALGEQARTIVVVSTANPRALRVLARFDPGFLAHDLAFAASGRSVWVSSAAGPDVAVLAAGDHRRLFAVAVGPPPQHIAMAGARVYLTSGYGSTIEEVTAADGRLLARAPAPYGSFELAAGAGYVATSSLLDGDLTLYTARLRRLSVVPIGPATRDVAITRR